MAASLLRVADSVASLDPLGQSLTDAEKLERSRRVLSLTLEATTHLWQCVANALSRFRENGADFSLTHPY